MAEEILIGRHELRARLSDLLGGAQTRGRMVGLVGEAGVGKSALQSAVVEEAQARGFTVLAARGSESETHLPFASLHQVLRPLLPRAGELPARQRDALLSGFGMGELATPDPFLLSLAALELVSDAARQAPVLVSLDDLPWMDEPSVDVFAFLARRVEAEPVMMLASVRTGAATPIGDGAIEWLPVPDLDAASSAALVARHAPDLAPELRDRVLREAAGNALALLEFPTAMASGRFGWTELSDDLPMTTRLERTFVSRVDALPAETRSLLTVAALDDGTDLAVVLTAAGALLGRPVGPETGRPAFEAGLLLSDGVGVRFRHPLVGSALRHSLRAEQRHAVHAALAQALAGQHPDRAAWHRASATDTADEEVAAGLEQAAGRALRRGAFGSAVVWLRRAAALTPDPATRASRLLGAAEAAFELGRYDQVQLLKQQVAGLSLHPRDKSRLIWLEGAFDDGSSADPAEVRRLIGLAEDSLRDADPDLALQLLLGAARRAWWGEPGDDVRRELVLAARAAGTDEDDPRLLAVLALTDGNEHAVAVRRGLEQWSPRPEPAPELAGLLGIAAFCIGDFARSSALLPLPAAELRAQGRLSVLAEVLVIQAWSALYQGAFAQGRGADEGMRLADGTGRSLWGAAARPAVALVDALRAAPEAAADEGGDLLAEADRVALAAASPMTTVLASVQLTRGLWDLAAGRPEAAYEHLRRVFDPADHAHHPVQQVWTLGYLAEAAVLTGRHDQAREVLGTVERLAGPDPAPAAAVSLAYAHAVLAADDDADAAFLRALEVAGRSQPWHRARAELAYGTWLRRRRRAVDARARLRSARDLFLALGVPAWADRAQQELRAAGEHGREPGPVHRPLLSPQEAEIAHLAAQGLSNREIAQRLYLSHRTVGSHLYRIFPKLGVTSRAQLGSVLAGDRAGH